jgi:hypothetical protein
MAAGDNTLQPAKGIIMNKDHRFGWTLAATLAACLATLAPARVLAAPAAPQPNVLVILTDDQG